MSVVWSASGSVRFLGLFLGGSSRDPVGRYLSVPRVDVDHSTLRTYKCFLLH